MKPTFSEFQFAYGLTRELEGPRPGIGLIDIPRIPTQNQEKDLPVDMVSALRDGSKRLAPLFIQYKRSEKMVRSNAGEWKHLKRRGIDLSDGYFRFSPYLGKHEQHNKLVNLGEHQPLTYYVAPGFIEHDEYRRHSKNGRLYQNTAFIQCGELRQVNREDHYITYTSQDTTGLLLSEPHEFSVQFGNNQGVFFEEVEEGLADLNVLREEFAGIRQEIVYGIDGEYDRDPGIPEFGNPEDYRADEPAAWISQQQVFFRETVDADLLFFVEE